MKRAGLNSFYGHQVSLVLAGVKHERASLCWAGPNRKHNSVCGCLGDRYHTHSSGVCCICVCSRAYSPPCNSSCLVLIQAQRARRAKARFEGCFPCNCVSQFMDIRKHSKNDVDPVLLILIFLVCKVCPVQEFVGRYKHICSASYDKVGFMQTGLDKIADLNNPYICDPLVRPDFLEQQHHATILHRTQEGHSD